MAKFPQISDDKHNIFKHRIPLRVFARKFLTFYKLLYNWLSCNNSSTLIGYSYTMGMACPALFRRRLWGGRMGPTQETAPSRLLSISIWTLSMGGYSTMGDEWCSSYYFHFIFFSHQFHFLCCSTLIRGKRNGRSKSERICITNTVFSLL